MRLLTPSRLLRCLAALAGLLAAPLAGAGYFQWDMVELPPESGASCGNGTPYRFFVNRTPLSRNVVVMYEGGGACWDQKACLGEGPLSASNPDGIPPDYLKQFNTAAFGLVTPFTSRNDPFQAVQTQSWNIVYAPYCTGDVHSGSKVVVYNDAYPDTPRVQYFRGQANARGMAQWLRANLGRPEKLLATGFSAGGVGSTVTYGILRDTLEPTGRSSLLADSGPLMFAPRGSAPEQYPSIKLHEKIRASWGLDEPGGLVTLYADTLPGFDANDLGSVSGALSQRYPDDRFGYMVFQADSNFSAFSYEKFYSDISDAPTERERLQALYARWVPDVNNWVAGLQPYGNVDFHVPFFRNFNDSHCLTIIDFSGTGIQEQNIADIGSFVDTVLDRGPSMRNFETDRVSDLTQVLSPAIRLFKLLSKLLG